MPEARARAPGTARPRRPHPEHRYGTTGCAPPGSNSGRAFVHDPKVSGVTEVKAQLKLRFKNYAGQRMVVVRSMQLTQRKTTATFKQMDGVIRANDASGERTSYTHKCGELDKTVPMLIGVSKAVLESVIFCHQEESSWPLQEGAVLKKKFDDIFESARYSKALDELRKRRLEKNAQVKELVGDLKGLQADKVAASDHRKRLEAAEAAVAECDGLIAECDEKSDAAHAELAQIKTERQAMEAREAKIAAAQKLVDDAEAKIAFMVEGLGAMGEMDETDDELAAAQREHAAEEERSDAALDALKESLETCEAAAASLRDDASKLDVAVGEQETEKKHALAAVGELRDALEGARADLSDRDAIRSLDAALKSDEAIPLDVAAKVRDDLKAAGDAAADAERACEADADAAVKAAHAAVNEKQAALDAARHEVEALGPKKKGLEKRVAASDDALKGLRSATEDAVAAARAKHDAAKEKIASHKAAMDAKDFKAQIRALDEKETSLGRDIEEENEAMRVNEASEDEEKELRVQEQLVKSSEERLVDKWAAVEELRAAAETALERSGDDDVVPAAPDRASASPADVHAFSKKVRRLLEGARDRAERAAKEQASEAASTAADARAAADAKAKAETALEACGAALDTLVADAGSSARDRLAKLRDKAEAFRLSTVRDYPDADEFEAYGAAAARAAVDGAAVLAGDDDAAAQALAVGPRDAGDDDALAATQKWVAAHVAKLTAKKYEETSLNSFSGKLLEKMRKVKAGKCPKCVICRREFDGPDDATYKETIARLEDQASDLKEKEFDLKIDAAKDLGSQLADLDTPWRRWVSAVGDRVAAKAADDDARAAAADAQTAADAAKSASDDAAEAFAAVKSAFLDADDLAEAAGDLKAQTETLDAKRSNYEAMSGGQSGRSTRDILEQLQRLNDEKNAAVTAKAKLEKENATGLKEETALVTRLGNVREELAKLERDVEARGRHEGDRADAANELKDLEAACKDLQKGDAKRKEALDDANEAAADAEADAARKKKAARSLTNGKKASFQEVQAAVDAAARGAERAAGADETLAALAADRETLETRVADADAEAKRAAAAIGDHASGNASRQAMKKAIDDNVNLRSARSARAAAASDVADLEDDRSGDAARRKELAARHDKLARDLNRLVSRRGEYVGRRSTEASVAKEHAGDLKGARYKGVEEKHRKALINKETTEMAAKDLEHYWGALDKALSNYHSLKIEEINRIVRELWQITYMGEDIDSIEIVSGEDAGSNRAARSYNYHVQMRKAGAALDMKGRCSAGQRVLASIVIRLALAQTFCIKCGILALDEPTTNLDEANRRSLAHGLSRIIAERAAQHNFQLVVITHDEEFIGTLRNELAAQAGVNMPEHYWRISREDVHGRHFSHISKVDMASLN